MKARAESVGDDLARWAVARETIRRASSIVNDARDAATRNRVLKLEQEIAKRTDVAEFDAKLVEQLAEVREAIDEIPVADTETAYAAAFQAAGLVPNTQPFEDTGRAMARRTPRTALALAVALDHWAALRLQQGDRCAAVRMTGAAQMADPDDFRCRLRAAFMEPNARARWAVLGKLAQSVSAADLPPVTAALLGTGLVRAGDPSTAESVLRPAQRRQPDDPWLAQVLAKALEKQSRGGEAIRYYFIARAAPPESTHAVAHALERQGESTEAIALFREAVRLNPARVQHLSCLAHALRARTVTFGRPKRRSTRRLPRLARR